MTRSRLGTVARSLFLLGIALLLFATAPVGAAPRATTPPQYPDAQWGGWGLSASFVSGKPKFTFAVYIGKNSNPPVVLWTETYHLNEECDILDASGAPTTLDISSSGYANFNGNVYIRCNTPDWGAKIATVAPHLSVAQSLVCECPPLRSPFWAAVEFILAPSPTLTTRANPLIDARELGLTFSLPTTGSTSLSQLSRANSITYTSGTWTNNTTDGNRVLVGQSGPLSVAVTEAFNELAFLTDSAWRPYFINTVRGQRFGHWLEDGTSGTGSGSFLNGFSTGYTLNTGQSVVYIGRDNLSGEMLNARVRELRADPGCYGF